jgi:hypothetical protein
MDFKFLKHFLIGLLKGSLIIVALVIVFVLATIVIDITIILIKEIDLFFNI